jgi:alkaline phosphatase D
MKFAIASIAIMASSKVALAQDTELPITTSDVFIQSGEVSDSSVNIMSRCNNEADSSMKLWVDGAEKDSMDVTSTTDFTHTFKVEGLSSNTDYTYQVQCVPADGVALDSVEGSFKTAPGADDAVPVNFVWAADLAGQGYGRNPDFEITNTNGETVKGECVVHNRRYVVC